MSFDDLLKDLQGQLTPQEESTQVTMEALFNETFMRKHSSFGSFDEFLADGNFQMRVIEDVKSAPDELWDRHVKRKTDFPDWAAMLDAANREYAAGRK